MTLNRRSLSAAVMLPALGSAQNNKVKRTVRFEIDMREMIREGRFKPETDRVGVRGAALPLSWQKTAVAKPTQPGIYVVEVEFERFADGGQPVQYKFRIDREGFGGDEGWEDGRNRVLTLTEPQTTVARRFNDPPPEIPAQRTGTIVELGRINSQHVKPRHVEVWLPPQYESATDRRYPVLYLHDGQNVFDARAAGAEWQVDEHAQALVLQGAIKPAIIVAVHHSGERFNDYPPTASWLPPARTGMSASVRAGGDAPKYAKFLLEELKPVIDARFRTLHGRAHTAVGGSSLGGLCSAWLALQYPQAFGAALVVSPSVWWDNEYIVKRAAQAWPARAERPKLWVDMGAHEGTNAIPAMRRLVQALRSQGFDKNLLHVVEDPEGTHDEASWARRVPAMLRYLYGTS